MVVFNFMTTYWVSLAPVSTEYKNSSQCSLVALVSLGSDKSLNCAICG